MNHANEMSEDVERALKRLSNGNFTLLNQSTLLKGVNDDPLILKDLSEALFKNKVFPYYLHVLDKVIGAQHFDLSQDKAIEIHEELKNITSGYLVPKLTREVAFEKAKTWIHKESP